MLVREGVDRWNSLRFGLVLSGGGAKGAYEAGAVRAMREMDVADRVYGVSGTSVGALNALMYAMDDGAELEALWRNVGLSDVIAPKRGEVRGLKDILTQINAQLSDNEGLCTQDALRSLIAASIDFDRVRAYRAKLFACAYDIEARRVEYFDLKSMSDEEITDAVLASAAIPHVYDAVMVRGRKYADGGINDPAYGVKNCDRTPIAPLQDRDYDVLIVVHLHPQETRDISHIGKMRLLHVYPSRPLEAVRGSGTINFTHASIKDRLILGYGDMTVALSGLLMEYLRGGAA
ncbi:MAG TPA: patatin-like phospholipase family protein [Clostridia bacterium]|nr:patatin-like phospholipase family protein [Clostridia bacterium]